MQPRDVSATRPDGTQEIISFNPGRSRMREPGVGMLEHCGCTHRKHSQQTDYGMTALYRLFALFALSYIDTAM
jgi:hypothetical protein